MKNVKCRQVQQHSAEKQKQCTLILIFMIYFSQNSILSTWIVKTVKWHKDTNVLNVMPVWEQN